MSFPPAPSTKVDWNKLGLSISTVNGHAQSIFSAKTGEWSTPTFVQDPYLRVHGLSPGLNYGQQAYEGLKAFRTPRNTISIFRPTFHAHRITHSAAAVSMPAVPPALFLSAVNLALSRNAEFVPPHDIEGITYIRPVLFGSSAQLTLSPPDEFTLAVYVQPGNSYHGVKPLDALVMEDFDRAAPRGTGSAKVGGNYAPVIRHQLKARAEGYAITLHLDSQTRSEVEEFSTSGFVGVRTEGEHVTLVVPDSKNVIQSVTSDSCVELAKSLGWTVENRSVKYAELSTFTEVIAAGTAAALLPIKSITRKSTGDKFVYQCGAGEAGPVCVRLAAMMKAIQKGTAEDMFGWCMEVTEVKDEVTANGNGVCNENDVNGHAPEAAINGNAAVANGVCKENSINGHATEAAINGNAVVANGVCKENGVNGHTPEAAINGNAAMANGQIHVSLEDTVADLSSKIDALTALILAQQQKST